MTERLIAKLDRLGAEAGIKEMTPEISRFAQLLHDDRLKQWDEWRAKREWVGLTEEDLKLLSAEWRIVYGAWMDDFARDIESKLKEKNT